MTCTIHIHVYENNVWLCFVFYFCRMAIAAPKLEITLAGEDRGREAQTADQAASNVRYGWNVAVTMHVWTCN